MFCAVVGSSATLNVSTTDVIASGVPTDCCATSGPTDAISRRVSSGSTAVAGLETAIFEHVGREVFFGNPNIVSPSFPTRQGFSTAKRSENPYYIDHSNTATSPGSREIDCSAFSNACSAPSLVAVLTFADGSND